MDPINPGIDGGEAAPDSTGDLDELDCVQVTPEHLRGNGTLHSSPFAGIAELIDNSVDSGARFIKMETRGDWKTRSGDDRTRFLVVIDDGVGMDREEALKTILIGHSMKRADMSTIGQFGNGLKSGSMRLGETMLLATKKNDEYTVLILCLRYLATVNKCYVPCISYKLNKGSKELEPTKLALESQVKHDTALALILLYSPFLTESALKTFLKTAVLGDTGTSICISNLRKLEDNKYELNDYKGDLVVFGRDEERNDTEEDHQSLSHYLQQLYFTPKAVLKINSIQVRVQDPIRSLAHPRYTLLSRKGMDQFARRQNECIEENVRRYEADRVKAAARSAELSNKMACVRSKFDKQMRADQRRAEDEANRYKLLIDALKSQKTSKGADIRLFMGIDVTKRGEPRMVFYSNGRRICTKLFNVKGANFKQLMGVVCLIDIPSTFLPTAQNRENFENAAELEFVVKKIVTHAKTYFALSDEKFKTPEFWKSLGYDHPDVEDAVDMEKEGVQKLLFEMMANHRQCAKCLKFRVVEWTDSISWIDTMENMEARVFLCPNGKCEKSYKEVKDEQIKELNLLSKRTVYDEENEKKPIVPKFSAAAPGNRNFVRDSPLAPQQLKKAEQKKKASSFVEFEEEPETKRTKQDKETMMQTMMEKEIEKGKRMEKEKEREKKEMEREREKKEERKEREKKKMEMEKKREKEMEREREKKENLGGSRHIRSVKSPPSQKKRRSNTASSSDGEEEEVDRRGKRRKKKMDSDEDSDVMEMMKMSRDVAPRRKKKTMDVSDGESESEEGGARGFAPMRGRRFYGRGRPQRSQPKRNYCEPSDEEEEGEEEEERMRMRRQKMKNEKRRGISEVDSDEEGRTERSRGPGSGVDSDDSINAGMEREEDNEGEKEAETEKEKEMEMEVEEDRMDGMESEDENEEMVEEDRAEREEPEDVNEMSEEAKTSLILTLQDKISEVEKNLYDLARMDENMVGEVLEEMKNAEDPMAEFNRYMLTRESR